MTYYDILGLSLSATADDIKKAYRTLAKKLHPDQNKGKTEDQMKALNQAYATLSNPLQKRIYDQTIGTGRQRKTAKGPYWEESAYSSNYNSADNPFGFNADYARVWEEMMRNMGKDWTTHDFTRKPLSTVRIKRILRQEMLNKKPYTSYASTTCDLCSNPISIGETFYFAAEKQKMCKACQKDILSHL